MGIQYIRRWQWLTIAMVLGLCLGYSRRAMVDDLSSLGEGINDQASFERRLIGTAGGNALFKNIYVCDHIVPDPLGKKVEVCLVRGMSVDDGAQRTEPYQPMWYLAPVPYHPVSDLYEVAGSAMKDPVQWWNNLKQPTVIDFLELARQGHGVAYTYAWWDGYPIQTYTIASITLIGLLWPCVIDLYYYGRLVRPRDNTGWSLWSLRASRKKRAKTLAPSLASGPGDMEAEVEQQPAETTIATTAGSSAPVVRALPTDDKLSPHLDDKSSVVFRADAEDFYPTEDRLGGAHSNSRSPVPKKEQE